MKRSDTPIAAWLNAESERAGLSRYALAHRSEKFVPVDEEGNPKGALTEPYLSQVAGSKIKKPSPDKIILMGRVLGEAVSKDPDEQIRIVNEGLAAAGHSPLARPGANIASGEVLAELRQIAQRVERIGDTLTLADSVAAASHFGTVHFDRGRVKGDVPAGVPENRDPMGPGDGDLFLHVVGGDYYLRVSGDSMKPFFDHGAWIIVRATEDPPIGRIVIAIVDGENVCKRLKSATDQEGEIVYWLEPSNHKYRAIRRGDIKFQGFVIKKVEDV